MADISKYFSVGINGVFHILILFSFLSVLFFTIIASIETKTFEEQIQGLSNSSVKEVFKNYHLKINNVYPDLLTQTSEEDSLL